MQHFQSCLLHYVWIPKHSVYRDSSHQAPEVKKPQVPPYYGTPQTKPGVTKNDRRNQLFKNKLNYQSIQDLK